MKYITTQLLFFLLCSYFTNAQETPIIELTYDAAGNRVSKEQVMVLQKQVESEPIKLNTFTRSQCSVKPNPVKERAVVSVQSDIIGADVKISVSDIKGNTLFTLNGSIGENDIDMSELANGVYFMRVIIDAEYADLKIIKQE